MFVLHVLNLFRVFEREFLDVFGMLGFHVVGNVVDVLFLNADCFSLRVQCVVQRDCFHLFLDA